MNFGLQSLVSDISISMFKVAAVMNHPGLKSELEILAISLAVDPCPENIFSAENLINLGREVGEVKPLNAVVLIRELENLRKNLSTVSLNSQAADVDISPKFTHSSSVTPARPPAGGGVHDVRVLSSTVRGFNQDNNESKLSSEPVHVSPKRTRPNAGRKVSLNSDKVYQYIVERKEAKLKELESAFSEVSGRTVRRMTDVLIKEGKIERVGNPGPTSYYRLISSSTISTSPARGPRSLSEVDKTEAQSSSESVQFYKENDIPELPTTEDSSSSDYGPIDESAPQFSYGEPDGHSDVITL